MWKVRTKDKNSSFSLRSFSCWVEERKIVNSFNSRCLIRSNLVERRQTGATGDDELPSIFFDRSSFRETKTTSSSEENRRNEKSKRFRRSGAAEVSSPSSRLQATNDGKTWTNSSRKRTKVEEIIRDHDGPERGTNRTFSSETSIGSQRHVLHSDQRFWIRTTNQQSQRKIRRSTMESIVQKTQRIFRNAEKQSRFHAARHRKKQKTCEHVAFDRHENLLSCGFQFFTFEKLFSMKRKISNRKKRLIETSKSI